MEREERVGCRREGRNEGGVGESEERGSFVRDILVVLLL